MTIRDLVLCVAGASYEWGRRRGDTGIRPARDANTAWLNIYAASVGLDNLLGQTAENADRSEQAERPRITTAAELQSAYQAANQNSMAPWGMTVQVDMTRAYDAVSRQNAIAESAYQTADRGTIGQTAGNAGDRPEERHDTHELYRRHITMSDHGPGW